MAQSFLFPPSLPGFSPTVSGWMWGRIAWSYSSGGKAVSARTYAQVPINSSSVWNSHWANTRNQLHVEVYPSLALPGSAFLSAESPDHQTALGCCLTLCLTCARWYPSLWHEVTIFPSWQTLWQDYWLSTQYPPQKGAQGWIENPTRAFPGWPWQVSPKQRAGQKQAPVHFLGIPLSAFQYICCLGQIPRNNHQCAHLLISSSLVPFIQFSTTEDANLPSLLSSSVPTEDSWLILNGRILLSSVRGSLFRQMDARGKKLCGWNVSGEEHIFL